MLRHLDLFSGIGGFSFGLENTDFFKTVAFCEQDTFCKKVLNKHWQDVPIYNDVKELSYDRLRSDGLVSERNPIHILTGGYPCQPMSTAGKRKGKEDTRYLFPEYLRLIKELSPIYAIGENVSGHIGLGLNEVFEDLEHLNYRIRCFSVEASCLGAWHRRQRVWWIAENISDSNHNRNRTSTSGTRSSGKKKSIKWNRRIAQSKSSGHSKDVSDSNRQRGCLWYSKWENAENVGKSSRSKKSGKGNFKSRLDRMAYGIPYWLHEPRDIGRTTTIKKDRAKRLKALGNAIVPQMAHIIGLAIKETHNGKD